MAKPNIIGLNQIYLLHTKNTWPKQKIHDPNTESVAQTQNTRPYLKINGQTQIIAQPKVRDHKSNIHGQTQIT